MGETGIYCRPVKEEKEAKEGEEVPVGAGEGEEPPAPGTPLYLF